MNKFIFLGRLTKDVEERYAGETQVAMFDLAVNRKFVAQGGERQADFFNLTSFGKTAEFCAKYFKKGQQVLVEGRIQNRSWDDQSGNKRYSTDYIAEQVYFADTKKKEEKEELGDYITIEDEELTF